MNLSLSFANVHDCMIVHRDVQCFHFKYPGTVIDWK